MAESRTPGEFEKFPEKAKAICLAALTIAAEGGKADIAKPWHGAGSGVLEIAISHEGDALRIVYAVQLGQDVWVIHAFKKKSTIGVVRGTGNVFRNFGTKNPDAEQFKAILAAEIIKSLDREHLTVRQAHARTGIAAADFSRLRNAELDRFTVDRLMAILNRLGARIEVRVRVRREKAA